MAKRRRRKAPKRRKTSRRRARPKRRRKSNKPRRSSKRVAKKRKGSRRGGIRSIGGFLKGGMVGNVVKGLGAGALATIVLQRVAPQFTGIGSVGAGFLGGGLIGGVANLLLTGGLSSLSGVLGSGQQQGGGGQL